MHDRPKSRRQVWRRFARETQAGPIVEFAIIVPVLLVLTLGLVEFAKGFFVRTALLSAAREGARLGAVAEFPCQQLGAIRGRVRAAFFAFGSAKPDSNATMIPISIVKANGNDACSGTWANDANLITVQVVSYPFSTALSGFKPFKGSNTVTLNVTAVYRWERAP